MNFPYILKMLEESRFKECGICHQAMTDDQKLFYWGGMNDMLCHWECFERLNKFSLLPL